MKVRFAKNFLILAFLPISHAFQMTMCIAYQNQKLMLLKYSYIKYYSKGNVKENTKLKVLNPDPDPAFRKLMISQCIILSKSFIF